LAALQQVWKSTDRDDLALEQIIKICITEADLHSINETVHHEHGVCDLKRSISNKILEINSTTANLILSSIGIHNATKLNEAYFID
jgi:hypothetical protein